MRLFLLGLLIIMSLTPIHAADGVFSYGGSYNIDLINDSTYSTKLEEHPGHWNRFDVTFNNLDTSNTSIVVEISKDSMYKLKLYLSNYGVEKGEYADDKFILPENGSMMIKFEQLIPVESAEDPSLPVITISKLNSSGEVHVELSISSIIQSDLVPVSPLPVIFSLLIAGIIIKRK